MEYRDGKGDNIGMPEKFLCLCTRSDESLFTYKISGSLVLWFVSFVFSKEEAEEDEEE